jgi:pimeloyl-ACP methyl ester carboxylesterase
MPYLETAPGVSLYYEDFGDGHPIIFTHAAQATHAIWEHQTRALTDEFRTITYDWRGVGRSSKPRTGYTVGALASDLLALIEQLDLGPATLVAQGVGTHAVLEAVYRRPERVARLVLVSGAPWFSGERDGVTGGLSDEFSNWVSGELGGSGRIGVQANANIYDRYMFHVDPGPAVAQWFLGMGLETPAYVLNSLRADLKDVDHRDRLSQVTCPVMLAQGRYDTKQRYDGAVYMAARLPNARLVTFEESAHQPELEEMTRFNEELRAFLKDG